MALDVQSLLGQIVFRGFCFVLTSPLFPMSVSQITVFFWDGGMADFAVHHVAHSKLSSGSCATDTSTHLSSNPPTFLVEVLFY